MRPIMPLIACLLMLARCCACAAAFLSGRAFGRKFPYHRPWFLEHGPSSQTTVADGKNLLGVSDNEQIKPSIYPAASQGPGGPVCKRWDWHSPVICPEDSSGYVYLIHMSAWMTFCAVAAYLVLPAAVGTIEQLLHSFVISWKLYWGSYDVDLPVNSLKDVLRREREFIVRFMRFELLVVSSAWRRGVDADVKALLSAAVAYGVVLLQWVLRYRFLAPYWNLVPDISTMVGLHMLGSCNHHRTYLRSTIFYGLLAACCAPLAAKTAVQVMFLVFMGMPSVDLLLVSLFGVNITVTAIVACIVAAVYLACGLRMMLRAVFKFLAGLSSLRWLCRLVLKYTGIALWCTVLALSDVMNVLVHGICSLVKEVLPYMMSQGRRMFVIVGASEHAAAAVISRHWQQLISSIHVQYQQLCRTIQHNLGSPAALLAHTVQRSVTCNVGVAESSGDAPGVGSQQRSKQQQQRQQQQRFPGLLVQDNINVCGSAASGTRAQPAPHSHSTTDGSGRDISMDTLPSSAASSGESIVAADDDVTAAEEDADLSQLLLLAQTSSKLSKSSTLSLTQQTSCQHGSSTHKISGSDSKLYQQAADTAATVPYSPASGDSWTPSPSSKTLRQAAAEGFGLGAGQPWATLSKEGAVPGQDSKGPPSTAASAQGVEMPSSKKKQKSNSRAAAAVSTANSSKQSSPNVPLAAFISPATFKKLTSGAKQKHPSTTAASPATSTTSPLGGHNSSGIRPAPAAAATVFSTASSPTAVTYAAAAVNRTATPPAPPPPPPPKPAAPPTAAAAAVAPQQSAAQPAIIPSAASVLAAPATVQLQAAALDSSMWHAVKAPAAWNSSKAKVTTPLDQTSSRFATVIAGRQSQHNTFPSAAAEPVPDTGIKQQQERKLPIWLQPALTLGAPVSTTPIQQQQQQQALASSSNRSELLPISPQVSGPYRPLQFSNTTAAVLSPTSSLTSTTAAAAAATAVAEAPAAETLSSYAQLTTAGIQRPITATTIAAPPVKVQSFAAGSSLKSASSRASSTAGSHWDAAWSALAAAAAAQLEQESMLA